MQSLGAPLGWMCAALVALPLAPCALLTSTCCPERALVAEAGAPQRERSCCTHHQANEQRAPREKAPCNRECCRIAPFVPLGEKLVVAAPLAAIAAVALPLHTVAWSASEAPAIDALASPVSLNILQCRWRC